MGPFIVCFNLIHLFVTDLVDFKLMVIFPGRTFYRVIDKECPESYKNVWNFRHSFVNKPIFLQFCKTDRPTDKHSFFLETHINLTKFNLDTPNDCNDICEKIPHFLDGRNLLANIKSSFLTQFVILNSCGQRLFVSVRRSTLTPLFISVI